MNQPDNLPQDLARALQAIEEGNFATARTIAEEAMAAGESDVRYLFVAGQATMYEDDYEGLDKVADALLRAAPDMVLGHVWKGDACRRLGDRAAALEHYETAVESAARIGELPPAVKAALARAEGELPTLRRQFRDEG